MKYCPLAYSQYGMAECRGEHCAMAADEAGQCLIQQALSLYVGKERTRLAEETHMMQMQGVLLQSMYPNKTSTIDFSKDDIDD